jgi:uncharacterized membrane protein YccC
VKYNIQAVTVKIQDAFYSEYFVDAMRTTLTVALPATLFFILGLRELAIGTGLGTLLTALCDSPGDIRETTNGLTISSVVLATVTLITTFALPCPVMLSILILAGCFGFSYMSIYGKRALSTGSLALVMMAFTIGLHPEGHSFSLYIFVGGIWYILSAVLYQVAFPFRQVRHALGECVGEIALFLRTKADFYDPAVPLNDCYGAVISGHIKVSEKQDSVRAILLKDTIMARQSSRGSLRLVHLASEIIDLYEQILATHYDYEFIRKTLFDLQVLNAVNRLMQQMADELSVTAKLIGQNRQPKTEASVMERLPLLCRQLQNATTSASGLKADLLKKVIVNFEVIDQKMQSIKGILLQSGDPMRDISDKDAFRFATIPTFRAGLLKEHFTLRSPVFRFSIRLSLMCFGAFWAALYLLHGKYDYWLLLTIVIVARPGFSTTRKRNFQRITGTAIGIGAAFTLSFFLDSTAIVVALLPLLLLGYLSFLHIDYLISVCFITVLAVTGLHLLGGDENDLLLARSYYTLLGGAISFVAAFIFPFWESRKMSVLLKAVLDANIHYLHQLLNYLSEESLDVIEYKLARKQIFISSANLSRAYQHMLSEPKITPLATEYIYRFQIHNHELYASAAALLLDGGAKKQQIILPEHKQLVLEAITFLEEAIAELTANNSILPPNNDGGIPATAYSDNEIAGLQLKLIHQQAKNIYFQTHKIIHEQHS